MHTGLTASPQADTVEQKHCPASGRDATLATKTCRWGPRIGCAAPLCTLQTLCCHFTERLFAFDADGCAAQFARGQQSCAGAGERVEDVPALFRRLLNAPAHERQRLLRAMDTFFLALHVLLQETIPAPFQLAHRLVKVGPCQFAICIVARSIVLVPYQPAARWRKRKIISAKNDLEPRYLPHQVEDPARWRRIVPVIIAIIPAGNRLLAGHDAGVVLFLSPATSKAPARNTDAVRRVSAN